jgi:hypothetical protein
MRSAVTAGCALFLEVQRGNVPTGSVPAPSYSRTAVRLSVPRRNIPQRIVHGRTPPLTTVCMCSCSQGRCCFAACAPIATSRHLIAHRVVVLDRGDDAGDELEEEEEIVVHREGLSVVHLQIRRTVSMQVTDKDAMRSHDVARDVRTRTADYASCLPVSVCCLFLAPGDAGHLLDASCSRPAAFALHVHLRELADAGDQIVGSAGRPCLR